MNDPNTLAAEFCAVLRSWLTPEQMEEVVRRNRVETHVGICHSHDFCDANEALLQAARNLGILPQIEDIDERCLVEDIWDEAWNRAKAAGLGCNDLHNDPLYRDMIAI